MPQSIVTPEATEPRSAGPASDVQTWILIVTVVAVIGLVLWARTAERRDSTSALRAIGTPMPELVAEGWINGEAPTSESLAGKVVVLEAWGPACSVCWKIAPQLDQIYEQYHDQGVEFVGLTAQGRFFLDDINRFIDENRIRWLNGYGAEETFEQLGVDSLPAIWIVGADGRIVWNQESPEDFTTALDTALARAAAGGGA